MLNNDYTCSKATSSDDIRKIAKYIHLTDDYIFPTICKDADSDDWKTFFSACSKSKNNLYNIDHISVVKYKDEIIGVACVVPCGEKWSFAEDIQIPESLQKGIDTAATGYFNPLIKEIQSLSGYNILNICVDADHRGKGVGSLLLRFCIQQYGAEIIHLDVITANSHAIELYKNYGFSINNEYMGFGGENSFLPCYHMIRNKQS